MNNDDDQFLAIGRELVRMIHDVIKAAGSSEEAYGSRIFGFPGVEVQVLIVSSASVADEMERAVTETRDVRTVTPNSQFN